MRLDDDLNNTCLPLLYIILPVYQQHSSRAKSTRASSSCRLEEKRGPYMPVASSSSGHLSPAPPDEIFAVLCSTCRRFFSQEIHPNKLCSKFDHHDFNSLRQSAKEGCQMCRMLCITLRQENDDDVWERLCSKNLPGVCTTLGPMAESESCYEYCIFVSYSVIGESKPYSSVILDLWPYQRKLFSASTECFKHSQL